MGRNARAVDRFGSLLGIAIVLLLVDAGAVVFWTWWSCMAETSPEERATGERLEPGKPLRPHPGSRQTLGGSMGPRSSAKNDATRPD